MNYDSPKEVSRLLESEGLSMKKRFGQNFLVSAGARAKLLDVAAPTSSEYAWEIGPGIGTMTTLLVRRVRRLVAFEIDHGFVRLLTSLFAEEIAGNPNTARTGEGALEIVPGDFLKTWRTIAERDGAPDLLFGNLPYRTAATMIGTLIEEGVRVKRIVATVQREVAQRMVATPGSPEYSGFSLLCQSGFLVRTRGDLAPASFFPAPEVTSTIVELRFKGLPDVGEPGLYFTLIRDLFAARRKTVRNNLLSGAVCRTVGREGLLAALDASGIDPGRRGETLSVAETARLSVLLAHAAGGNTPTVSEAP